MLLVATAQSMGSKVCEAGNSFSWPIRAWLLMGKEFVVAVGLMQVREQNERTTQYHSDSP